MHLTAKNGSPTNNYYNLPYTNCVTPQSTALVPSLSRQRVSLDSTYGLFYLKKKLGFQFLARTYVHYGHQIHPGTRVVFPVDYRFFLTIAISQGLERL